MQKRLAVLAISLTLAGITVILPVMALADPVAKAEKVLFTPYWVAILVWLTAPITTAILVRYRIKPKLALTTIAKHSSIVLVLQAALVAIIYFATRYNTSASGVTAFLIVTIFPSVVLGYFAFKVVDDLSKE